jgi:hypothetical protein
MFRELYFAVPHELAGHPDIPEHAGIINVNMPTAGGYAKTAIIRRARPVKSVGKISDTQRLKLAELGSMRIWDLKKHLSYRKKP